MKKIDVNVRRLQQILSKKNTYSLDIDNRDSRTGQVTGADKIARISDSELYGLTVFKADSAIKEFYSARADNMVAKQDMYSKISKYGYVYLDELNSDITKNQTINTINTYLLGAGIKSDLLGDDSSKAEEILKRQVIDSELEKMSGIKKESTSILNEDIQPLEYYIVYSSNSDGKQITPRIPKNYMTNNGFEDDKTPRVCASNSISGCLKGLSKNLKNMKLFVHKAVTDEKPYTPLPSQVPDCKITGEVWFKSPIKLKCVGEILVTSDDGKPGQSYTYGPDKKEAKLYGWNYKWLNKFDVKENNAQVQSLSNFKKQESFSMNPDNYMYIAITEEERLRGYIDYPLTEEFNGKYINLTLEGLESFLTEQNLCDKYNHYVKVPISEAEIMLYDDKTDSAVIKLPFAKDIEDSKNLFRGVK